MNKTEATRSWFSELVEKEVKGADPYEDRGLSIAIVVAGVLIGSFFVAHQAQSTGFFTAAFGTLEMLLLYGTHLFWIVTSALIVVGQKDLSRDLDLRGAPLCRRHRCLVARRLSFDFAHLADLLPESLRFVVQWLSDDIARVLMVLGFLVHLGLAVYRRYCACLSTGGAPNNMPEATGGRFGLRTARADRWGMMRLRTVGRRSGKERTAILGYFEDGPDLVTMAMNGWADPEPAWWLNLQAQPEPPSICPVGRAPSTDVQRTRTSGHACGPGGPRTTRISTHSPLGGPERPRSSSCRPDPIEVFTGAGAASG